MELWQFRQMVDELGDSRVRTFLGIGAATLRRWKTGQSRIQHAAVLALRLHFWGDLSALAGDAWQGFRIADGLLYIPGWKHGWTPHSIRAMFFEVQELRALRAENKTLRAEAEALRDEVKLERVRADEYQQMFKRLSRWVALVEPRRASEYPCADTQSQPPRQ